MIFLTVHLSGHPLARCITNARGKIEYDIDPYPSYHSCFTATTSAMNVTEYHVGGHLVSRVTVQSDTDRFMAVIQDLLRRNVAVSGYSLNASRANNQPPSNAVNPIWRKTAISLVIGLYVTLRPPLTVFCACLFSPPIICAFYTRKLRPRQAI